MPIEGGGGGRTVLREDRTYTHRYMYVLVNVGVRKL